MTLTAGVASKTSWLGCVPKRKPLDDDIRKEIKDYANQKWVFFALYDDTFEIRNRDKAGGDIRLKQARRRITLKRPPGPHKVPRP